MMQFLNYQKHPEKKDYRVFYYRNALVFESMKQGLTSAGIPFDCEIENDGTETFYVIVHADYFDNATEYNNQSLMKVKRPFLEDKGLRYFILAIFFIFTSIAFTGYIVTHFFK